MSIHEKELFALLDSHKFVLVRSRKHLIYRNPMGVIVSISHSPSDQNAYREALQQLKRDLNLVNPVEHDVNQITVSPQLTKKEKRENQSIKPFHRLSFVSPAQGVKLNDFREQLLKLR